MEVQKQNLLHYANTRFCQAVQHLDRPWQTHTTLAMAEPGHAVLQSQLLFLSLIAKSHASQEEKHEGPPNRTYNLKLKR